MTVVSVAISVERGVLKEGFLGAVLVLLLLIGIFSPYI
jgi:hypothetical protein